MTESAWHTPDADDTGFVSLYRLAKRAGTLERDDFVRAYPVPALVAHYEEESIKDPAKEEGSGVQLLTMAMPSSGILRYLNKICFLCKRPGNPYAHLVSIGRSHTNDIVLAVDSVSKVHGYFVEGAGGWSYTDRSSTNGSALDGETIEPGTHVTLRDGCHIKIGLDVTLEVLEPVSLHARLLTFLS